jgi:monofunctional biosynthetic peptidoglycan transglycosylase
MKTAIILILTFFLMSEETTLFDFDSPETSGEWYIVNDDVMGGISTSKMTVSEDGFATFSGTLSPENYGGFASIRALVNTDPEKSFDGIKIRLRGDGNIYSLRFRTDKNFDGYAYQAKVKSIKGEWKEFKVPFKDFTATFRGRTLTDKPALKYEDIAQFGLLIADKQFGEFSVDVDWIGFYSE